LIKAGFSWGDYYELVPDENINQIYFIKDNTLINESRFCYDQNYLVFKEQSVMIDREDAVFTGRRWFNRLTLYQRKK